MRNLEAAGISISRIGLGTWQFGSREWGYGQSYIEDEAPAIVDRALELGINLIDTAEIYGFGRSERAVGSAIAGRRESVFIATKIAPVAPIGPIVRWRARRSASRLGVDKIDLYQLHWPNMLVPASITMGAMGGLIEEGLVANVGVSNYSLDKWTSAEEALGSPVISNQVEFSLVDQRPLRRLLPYAEENDRIIIAYSPLAKGLLSAKYSAENLPTNMVRRRNSQFSTDALSRAEPLFEALREIAEAHDAKPSQVALAWVISHPNVVAIPGASSVGQLEENAAAADLLLTEEEVNRLTELGAPVSK